MPTPLKVRIEKSRTTSPTGHSAHRLPALNSLEMASQLQRLPHVGVGRGRPRALPGHRPLVRGHTQRGRDAACNHARWVGIAAVKLQDHTVPPLYPRSPPHVRPGYFCIDRPDDDGHILSRSPARFHRRAVLQSIALPPLDAARIGQKASPSMRCTALRCVEC